LIATLLLSQGVPMICGGDELSHTQNGNNNTYCQDNELTWLNWELGPAQQSFLEFVRKAAQIWKEQPVFQRRRFFLGRRIRGSDIKDLCWFTPAGQEMPDSDWDAGFIKCLGVRLAGDLIGDVDERGEPILGETLLLLLNAHHEAIPFALPATKPEHHWECLLDTAADGTLTKPFLGGEQYGLKGRSLVVFRTVELAEIGQVVTAIQAEGLRKEKDGPKLPHHVPAQLTTS
jgi:glycogen operon protein